MFRTHACSRPLTPLVVVAACGWGITFLLLWNGHLAVREPPAARLLEASGKMEEPVLEPIVRLASTTDYEVQAAAEELNDLLHRLDPDRFASANAVMAPAAPAAHTLCPLSVRGYHVVPRNYYE